MKINRDVSRVITRMLDRYTDEVETSPLKANTKRTYLLHAENFVKWLHDDFEPGGTLTGQRRRSRTAQVEAAGSFYPAQPSVTRWSDRYR